MNLFRVVVLALAVLQALMAGLTALVGGFADGGDLFSRLTLMLIHPVTAVVLVYVAAVRSPLPRVLMFGSALIVINVIADVALALSISAGTIKGDWWLPLVFSVIPLIGLVYALLLLSRRAE